MTAPQGPTYREFARMAKKFPLEPMLRTIAALAVDETTSRLNGHKVEPPITAFTLAGLARTCLVAAKTENAKRGHQRGVGRVQIERLCNAYISVYDPARGADGTIDIKAVMTRIAFEQFSVQYSPKENLTRAHSLFLNYATTVPGMPSPAEWEDLLGTDLDSFMRTGFALHVAMMNNQGSISRDVLQSDAVRSIWEPLEPTDLFDIVDRLFARTMDQHRDLSRKAELTDREKWSYSSLTGFPLVAIGNDLVCPAPHLLMDRVTATGLWYLAQEKWKSRFTDALGPTFEAYVGDQLRLLEHVQVLDQIPFLREGSNADSCDYILVADEAVILVEVKCARPTLDYRAGGPDGLADLTAKLATAVGQLEATAKLISDRHPSFAHIPVDRPLCGLVVTLEPYHLRQTFREHLLDSDVLTIGTAWAHELETSMAHLQQEVNAGEQLLKVLQRPDGVLASITDVIGGRRFIRENPIVQASWDAWAVWPAIDVA